MGKRILEFMMAGVVMSTLLMGCGASQKETELEALNMSENDTEMAVLEESEPESGTVPLTVWAEAANHELLNEMAASFQEEYKGKAEFDIQIVESMDANTRNDVLGDVHNAADVFFFADDQLSSMAAGGVLAKVPNADEVRNANSEGSVEAASVDDILYAYPMSADNGYFLYYNKAYFSETDVQSLDTILQIAAENGKKFSMQWDSGWYLYAFFGNTGLEFGINDDGVTNYCNWNTTEGDIKGVDIVNSMQAIAANPGFLNLPDSELVENVKNGTVIAAVSGIWNSVELQEAWGDDYGAVELPSYTCAGQQIHMASFVGYKMVGVNAYSEHRDWALKFADWITNEQNQVLRFEKRSQGPSNINAAASDEVKQVAAIQAVTAQSEYGVLQRVGNNYWTPFQEYGENLAALNPAGIEPQEMIDNLVAGITASTID